MKNGERIEVRMRIAIKILCLGLFIAIYGCSSNKNLIIPSVINYERKSFQIPAGVDSAVAYQAKRKADRLFVDVKRENHADSLLKISSDYLKITQELYVVLQKNKDALDQKRQTVIDLMKKKEEEKTQTLEEQRKYEKALEEITDDSLTIVIVTSLLDYYLDFSDQIIREGIEFNPFDLRGLQYLGLCGWNRSAIFTDTAANRQAVESLVKFLNYERGNAHIYKEIGKNYYQLKQWEKAYEYLYQARDIYLITSAFDNAEQKFPENLKNLNLPKFVDPKAYYDFLYYKGQAEMRVYKSDSALATFAVAHALAPTKEDADQINDWVVNWIKWDNGNIYAAEQKFIIIDSLNYGNYNWAKNAFLRLLPQIRTKKARDNITWRLAFVEYTFLDQKEEGANRLYNLVMNADTTNRASGIYKAPEDSLYKHYFKDCGNMLFSLGNEYLNQGLQAEARKYFAKDTTFEWAGRIKAFLPLASLVEVPTDIAPEERLKQRLDKMIKLFNRVKLFASDLDDKEVDFLYGNLNMIYRSLRDPKMLQQNFREWQEIKGRHKQQP